METLAIVLLAVIALSEVSRLYLTHRGTSKKAHFVSKLRGVEGMIYDLEFKRFKTREIREDIRKEYDNLIAQKSALEPRLNSQNKEEKATAEDRAVIIDRDSSRFQAQMKSLDEEIIGAPKTNENPDGRTGINSDIESLKELKGMLKDWIATL